jgi:drug/metabolite transporter (DMT)-like permease
MQDTGNDAEAGSRRTRLLAFVALAVLAIIWGYGWVTMRIAVRYVDPFAFAAMRTFLGSVSLFAILLVLKRPLRPKALPLTVAFGVLQTGAFACLAAWAVKYAPAGKVSVLVYTMPFWLLLFAWVFLGERLRGLQWVAILLAVGGLVLIFRPWDAQGRAGGEALALGAGLCWAASAVIARLIHARHRVDLLSFTAWQMLLGSLPVVLIAGLATTRPPVWSGSFIGALLYQVLLSTALAYYLWVFILRVLPANIAGLGTLLTPVVGLAAAWLQLGERVGIWEGVGMLFIIAALALLTGRELFRRQRRGRADSIQSWSTGAGAEGLLAAFEETAQKSSEGS